jgi:predicted double-glycine peptidase
MILESLLTLALAAPVFAAATVPRLPADALRLPLVLQETDYGCGAAALLSVLKYWRAYDGDEKSLYGPLGTTPADGTDPQKLAAGARSLGLKARWRENLRLADLRAALARGDTPILDIEAWPDAGAEKITWRDDWDDGHYVALIGMDADFAYFMDPSTDGKYAYIPLPELLERWHDVETRGGAARRYVHFAVFIRGAGAPAGSALEPELDRLR